MKTGETVWLADGRTLVLGALIKSGGAGSVYPLPGSPAQVAKLYHPQQDRVANRKKLAAMLALSPELPDQLENGKRHVQIAWPQAALQDRHGNFLGFVTRRASLGTPARPPRRSLAMSGRSWTLIAVLLGLLLFGFSVYTSSRNAASRQATAAAAGSCA